MKKKAEDLNPGDIWVIGRCRYSILAITDAEEVVGITYCELPNVGEEARLREHTTHQRAREFEVESPTLTPAQQHAEELLELVRGYGKLSLSGWENSALELLARIDPPKPPSAEELAEALERALNSCGYSSIQEAQSVLDRARQAGMLKDPQ